MNKVKQDAMEKFREAFRSLPDVVEALEKTLEEREDTLTGVAQIHGDHLHMDILMKGPTYWYGIWIENGKGEKSKMTRVCDYLGIEIDDRGIIKYGAKS